MSTPAQQYRSLVDKLEQLSELKIGDINPATGKRIVSGATDSQGNLIPSGTPGVYWNAKEEPVAPTAPAAAPAAEPAAAPAAAPAAEPAAEPAAAPAAEPAPAAAQEKCGPEVKEKIKAQKTFNAAYALAKQSGCDTFDWCQIVTVPSQSGIDAKPSQVTTPPEPQRRRQWDWLKGELGNQPGSDLPPAAEGIELEEATFIPGLPELDRIREIAGTAIVEQNTMGKPADPKTKCTMCGMSYEQHVNPDGSSRVRHPFVYKSEGSAPAPAPAAAPSNNTIPEIKAGTKQKAIEIAQKQGIKQFRYCGKYKVQDAPAKKPTPSGIAGKPTAPAPAPEPQRRRQFGGLNPNVELGPQSGSDLPIAP